MTAGFPVSNVPARHSIRFAAFTTFAARSSPSTEWAPAMTSIRSVPGSISRTSTSGPAIRPTAAASSSFGSMASMQPIGLSGSSIAATTGSTALADLPDPVSPMTRAWRQRCDRGTRPSGYSPSHSGTTTCGPPSDAAALPSGTPTRSSSRSSTARTAETGASSEKSTV